MKYYIDITLIAGPELPLYFLWEKVYQQLHLALVDSFAGSKAVPVAAAFPEYNLQKRQLGKKLRLLAADEEILNGLAIARWMGRLTDYVHMTRIRAVPKNIRSYVRFKRRQPKASIERLARRMAKRAKISPAQALSRLGDYEPSALTLPFIRMKSLSRQKRFPLFIAKEPVNELIDRQFGRYGLSNVSSVPEF